MKRGKKWWVVRESEREEEEVKVTMPIKRKTRRKEVQEGKKQNRTDETKDGRKKKPRTIEKSKHGRQENIRHEGHTTNRTEEQKKKGEQKHRKEGRNERWDHLVSFQTFDPLEMLYTPKDS